MSQIPKNNIQKFEGGKSITIDGRPYSYDKFVSMIKNTIDVLRSTGSLNPNIESDSALFSILNGLLQKADSGQDINSNELSLLDADIAERTGGQGNLKFPVRTDSTGQGVGKVGDMAGAQQVVLSNPTTSTSTSTSTSSNPSNPSNPSNSGITFSYKRYNPSMFQSEDSPELTLGQRRTDIDEVILEKAKNKTRIDADVAYEEIKKWGNQHINDSKTDNVDVTTTPKEKQWSFPLTPLVSTLSMLGRKRANNRIYNTLKRGLKPVVIDTPRDINYTIQGNEGVRSQYHKAAGNTRNQLLNPTTSDMNSWLGYSLAVNKQANDYALQGDLANEQALQQSREKAFQVQSENQRRREQVAAQNRQSITNMNNYKVQLNAQRIGKNSDINDRWLHDITAQIKQKAGQVQKEKMYLKDIDLKTSMQTKYNRIQFLKDLSKHESDIGKRRGYENEIINLERELKNLGSQQQANQYSIYNERVW